MDKEKLWKKITEHIRAQTASDAYKTWFSGVSIQEMSEQKIIICTPSAFIQQNIGPRYLHLIDAAIEQEIHTKPQIEFIVSTKGTKSKNIVEEEVEEEFFQPQTQPVNQSINPKYTMENFVVGLNNNVAYAAAQAVAQNPGTSYNPLFLYGGTGVGKTHLMLGVGNDILKKKPGAKIIYCSSEQFMNDYVSAIQERKTNQLRAKYRSADVLLIDDIQFFSGREGTQEEFFHTFNELQGKNAQIVLTSDRSPHEIAKLEDRLKSRFAGGLMIDIQPPDFDTRVAILKAKSKEWGSEISDESLKLIASSTQSNIRELEGKLRQVIQVLKAQNLEATPENIISFLKISPQKKIDLTHKEVLSAVCSFFNLNPKDLTGPKRQKELVLPRHLTMYILSEELGMTVEKIGQILGGRDHTTVMHGRDKIKNSITNDTETQRLLVELKNTLSAGN